MAGYGPLAATKYGFDENGYNTVFVSARGPRSVPPEKRSLRWFFI